MIYQLEHYTDDDGRQIIKRTPIDLNPMLSSDEQSIYTITVPFPGDNGLEPREREIANVKNIYEAMARYEEVMTLHFQELKTLINQAKLAVPAEKKLVVA